MRTNKKAVKVVKVDGRKGKVAKMMKKADAMKALNKMKSAMGKAMRVAIRQAISEIKES